MNELQIIDTEELYQIGGGCTYCKVGETMMAVGGCLIAPSPFSFVSAAWSIFTTWF